MFQLDSSFFFDICRDEFDKEVRRRKKDERHARLWKGILILKIDDSNCYNSHKTSSINSYCCCDAFYCPTTLLLLVKKFLIVYIINFYKFASKNRNKKMRSKWGTKKKLHKKMEKFFKNKPKHKAIIKTFLPLSLSFLLFVGYKIKMRLWGERIRRRNGTSREGFVRCKEEMKIFMRNEIEA